MSELTFLQQKLSLTPVIELGYYNQGNEMPSLGEKALCSAQWLEYRKECMRLAGMPNPLPPTVPGTDFYTLEIFSGDRLEWLITQHVQEYIKTEPEQIRPFFGGYILSEDAETLLNPQCCGDLSDVIWWKHVCYLKECVYNNGHPAPQVIFTDSIISFVCADEDDPFDPETKPTFAVEQSSLIAAYENMLPKLLHFKNSIAQAVERLELPTTVEFDLSSVLTVNNIELSQQDPSG